MQKTTSRLIRHIMFRKIFCMICREMCGLYLKRDKAKNYIEAHPAYNVQKDFLHDMPGNVWTVFEKR